MLAAATLTAGVEDYRRQVQMHENATLFKVTDGAGDLCGFYILRVDTYVDKKVGVLVAAAGRAGFSLADALMPTIEKQFIGCDELQQYCRRPGMVRKLLKQDWEPTHIAMRKVLKNG